MTIVASSHDHPAIHQTYVNCSRVRKVRAMSPPLLT